MSTAPGAAEAYADESLWPASGSELADVKTFHDARKAKIASEVVAGDLLDLEVMSRRFFSAVRQCRDALLRLPDGRHADVAAALGVDAFPVHDVLREAIELVLTAVSDALLQAMTEDRGDE